MAGIGLVIDPLRTNVAIYGAAEATIGWERGTGTGEVLSDGFSEAWKFSGSSSRYLKFKSTAANQAANIHCGRSTALDIPVEEGKTYTFSLRYKLVQKGVRSVQGFVQWFNGANALISTVTLGTASATGEGRVNATAVAPAAATHCIVNFGASADATYGLNAGETIEVYVDQVVVEMGTAIGYADFPTTAQLESGYAAWTGAANESASQVGEGVPTILGAVQLDLNDGVKYRAMDAKYPMPARDVNWAQSADTEGALPANLRYQNRQISITCRVYGSSASDLQAQLGYLEQKVGKINEEQGVGGTHEYVSPSGVTCVFDLLEASADYELDNTALANRYTTATITFTAKPFWRSGLAHEVAGTDHVETTLPCVIGVDTAIGGDVPALGRLVIDNDQEADQLTVLWGIQSRYYSTAATAELFYQAETRMPLSATATAALAGASGSGNNTILCSTLIPNWQAVLSTQASGGGAHLSHIGSYRVFARVQRPVTNTGEVSVCLEWGQGDYLQSTQNDPVTYAAGELEGEWALVNLGLVHLDRVTAGTQRWEGRILVKSSANGDKIYVDCLMLFPVDEGYGELKVVPTLATPTSVSGHDEFDQEGGGTLSGKVAPVGGTWSEAGHAGTFNLDSTGHSVNRTSISDKEGEGRVAILGTSEYTNIVVGADIYIPQEATGGGGAAEYGVVARYSSITKGFFAWVTAFKEPYNKNKWAVSTGGVLGIFSNVIATGYFPTQVHDMWLTLRVMANANGNWQFWCNGVMMGSGFSALLATGGELAKGKVGIYDQHPQPFANTRYYDNFVAFPPALDAAAFSKQSAEVRSDRAVREDATGALWTPRSDYKGAYFRPPPARREARSIRSIVKLSRGNTDLMADSAIDDASFKIFWQTRGLVLPES